MNNLNKAGYKIDKDKTDMEEFALMIKAAASVDLLSTKELSEIQYSG